MERFKNILLIADGGCWRETAFQKALSLAQHNQADLTLIRCVDFPQVSGPPYTRIKNGSSDKCVPREMNGLDF